MSITCVEAPGYGLENLLVLSVRFELAAVGTVLLPAFSGSTFRGLLGHVLKSVACHRDCHGQAPCAYHYLFETAGEERGEEVARPYVLEPPTAQRVVPAGERFALGLRLIGGGVLHLATFIYAIEEMGRMGIGHRQNQFRLDRATWLTRQGRWRLFYLGAGRHGPGRFVEEPEPLPMIAPPAPAGPLMCRFDTPLRLVHHGEVAREPHFHVLVRALLRRLDTLLRVHHGTTLEVDDYRDLVRRAEACPILEQRVRWFDWERHSNRQQRSMRMGGLVGDVVYGGELHPFWPLLQAGTFVHAGKATTFGLGKMSIAPSY